MMKEIYQTSEMGKGLTILLTIWGIFQRRLRKPTQEPLWDIGEKTSR
jgi:hypothetical protein